MELIQTDARRYDVGFVAASGDFEFGTSSSDGKVELSAAGPLPALGSVIYAEGTDVGIVVQAVDTTGDLPTASGPTWTGMLAEGARLMPPSGSAYRTLSGDLNDVLREVVRDAGLSGVVEVVPGKVGIPVSQVLRGSRDEGTGATGRFATPWDAVWQVCQACGCKVKASWEGSPVRLVLSGARSADYSEDELVCGLVDVKVSVSTPVNDLLCLGKGEGVGREVIRLFADSSGNVSDRQTVFGALHRADTYSNTSSENLRADGTKKLREMQAEAQTVEVLVSGSRAARFDLGDVVAGTDLASGVSAKATVSQRVVRLVGNVVSETYKTTRRW